MKRFAIIASAIAMCAISLASCKKQQVDLDTVTEDGFYVVGEATGAQLGAAYMMTAGVNEVDGQKRSGMFEKYVALKAGKDFELTLYKAGEKTRYSATLEDFDTNGEGDQPTVTLKRGVLIVGADAPAMQVAEDGLYHIVLDLNEKNDLKNAQIIVAPVSWGVRGVNGNWGWTEMTASSFDLKTMSWTIDFPTTSTGDFKFSYGGGWKIQLDDAGLVKAHTNLGVDCVNGASNIDIWKGEEVTITLTWKLSDGPISNNYSYDISYTKKLIDDPASDEFEIGLIGAAVVDWNTVTKPVVNMTESNVTDPVGKDGTYVYYLNDFTFNKGEFKLKVNGGWYGVGNLSDTDADGKVKFTLSGITYTGTDNFIIAAGGTYDVKFTLVWAKGKAKAIEVVFTAK